MNKGFTLIEVIVVMAIVSILTGIMIPFVYRVWESSDIENTSERLLDLKRAMVGDPRLMQSGMRTHYGYVGDCGQLPIDLKYLVEMDQDCPNWKGPYLPPGFNQDDYKKDAWGKEFIYDHDQAKITSKGLDRIQGTADDISIDITSNEISEAKPVSTIWGNLFISLYNSTAAPVTPVYYSKVTELLYNQGTGCTPLDAGTINAGETKTIVKAFGFPLGNALTKGKVIAVRGNIFNDSSCSIAIASTDINVFVASISEELFTNIPISYRIQ